MSRNCESKFFQIEVFIVGTKVNTQYQFATVSCNWMNLNFFFYTLLKQLEIKEKSLSYSCLKKITLNLASDLLQQVLAPRTTQIFSASWKTRIVQNSHFFNHIEMVFFILADDQLRDLGPDHVQVNWKHKSIGNISQLETRPLIG